MASEALSTAWARVSSMISMVAGEAYEAAYEIVHIRLYPPSTARRLVSTVRLLLVASLASSIVSAPLMVVDGVAAMLAAVASLALLASAYLAPWIVRLAVGMGVDREVPALLAYSLPYASSARYLVDVLVNLPRRRFRWTRYEAERLSYLLDLGYDPLQALDEIASTTPSKKLRQVLRDYLHAQKLGAPKSAVTLRLVEWAMSEVRGAWRSYSELGRGLVEAVTAAIIAGVAMAPLALMAGNVNASLYALPMIASPAVAVLLLAVRPEIGDYRGSMLPATIGLVAVLASAGLGLILGWRVEAGLLAALSLVVEALSLREARREREAFNAFREAVEEARYGVRLEEALSRAGRVAGGVAAAIVDAVRVAGRIGVGEALGNLLRVVEEARASRAGLAAPALILATLAAAAPAVSVYMLASIAGMSGSEFLAGDPRSLAEAARLITALSPLAPLPASVLGRGWRPSLLPSLAALAASQAVLAVKLSP